MLVEAVHDLALPVAEQIALFKREQFDVDELALSFDDAYQLVPQLHERGQIDRQLAGLTDDPTPQREWLWSDEALSVDPRWSDVRRIATELLVTLRPE